MRKLVVIAVLAFVVVLTAAQAIHAATGNKCLPSFCPLNSSVFPCLGVFLTENDVTEVLANGRSYWNGQLAPMSDDLDRYGLWDEAERLWMTTELSIRSLVGQGFSSWEKAFGEAYYRLDTLIASAVSILRQLVKKQKLG